MESKNSAKQEPEFSLERVKVLEWSLFRDAILHYKQPREIELFAKFDRGVSYFKMPYSSGSEI